ncbi:Hsp70 family protein, partial [Acinetobacter baumannii]|nr:Hsp70 family protein [Acinetobacter baumannii]
MIDTKPLIAIDLGTSNSLVGIFENGQSKLINNPYGMKTTPSAIALDEQGQILIGQAALELRSRGKEVLTSFKRLMGTSKRLKLGQQTFSAVELSSLILKSLKQDVEQALQCEVEEAVITVPAYFNDIQRQATISAAELAGLKVSRLINEPTAAALAYGLGQTQDSCFLIFDLGGGTF